MDCGMSGWTGRLLGCLLLLVLSVPLRGAETVDLLSSEGRKLEAVLLERGKDAVKVEVGRKIYVLPFDKLAAESVALVKAANLPVMCNFEILVDLKKRADKVERMRNETVRVGNELMTQVVTDSYRVDEVDGEATVRNRDVADPSPAGVLYVAVLCNGKSGHNVMRLDQFALASLDPLSAKEFEVEKSKSWHSERGKNFGKGNIKVEGNYAGYVAAVVVDGKIAAVKTSPPKYEQEPEEVRRLIGLAKPEKKGIFPAPK